MKLNVEYLNNLIDELGLKRSSIAKSLGISNSSFYNKSHGLTDFTYSEAVKLFGVLNASKEQQKKIFVVM